MKVAAIKIGGVVDFTNELFVGSEPNSKEYMRYLLDTLKVKHVVAMRNPRSHYQNYLSEDDEDIQLHVLDYPEDTSTWSESKMIEWMLEKGKTLSKLKGGIFIHNRTGRDEEAMLAFAVWANLDVNNCPINIQAWLNEHEYPMVIDNEERRRMTTAVIKITKKRNVSSLLRFIRK